MMLIDKKDFGSSQPLLTTSDQLIKSPDDHFDEDFANKKAAENLTTTVCDPMKQTNNKMAVYLILTLYPDCLYVKLNSEQFLYSASYILINYFQLIL